MSNVDTIRRAFVARWTPRLDPAFDAQFAQDLTSLANAEAMAARSACAHELDQMAEALDDVPDEQAMARRCAAYLRQQVSAQIDDDQRLATEGVPDDGDDDPA